MNSQSVLDSSISSILTLVHLLLPPPPPPSLTFAIVSFLFIAPLIVIHHNKQLYQFHLKA